MIYIIGASIIFIALFLYAINDKKNTWEANKQNRKVKNKENKNGKNNESNSEDKDDQD